MTSVPTSIRAATTRPVAPPGMLLILLLGEEDFQTNRARTNWAARKEMPTSTMVSLSWASMRWPWVEMSAGGVQVCRMMGTADAMARMITTMANVLPIPPRICGKSAGAQELDL